jgi:hypothetical protein
MEFRVSFTLYSKDGNREVEVREFRNGETYIVERERANDGTFEDRHSGNMVGPFASPEKAESFIVATKWFQGLDQE